MSRKKAKYRALVNARWAKRAESGPKSSQRPKVMSDESPASKQPEDELDELPASSLPVEPQMPSPEADSLSKADRSEMYNRNRLIGIEKQRIKKQKNAMISAALIAAKKRKKEEAQRQMEEAQRQLEQSLAASQPLPSPPKSEKPKPTPPDRTITDVSKMSK